MRQLAKTAIPTPINDDVPSLSILVRDPGERMTEGEESSPVSLLSSPHCTLTMLPSQQLEQRRQRLARLAEERDSQLASTSARPSPQSTPAPAPRRTVSSLPGEKTCWICYETSLESPHRPFIHACNCTLLAHPDCLLEWISTRPSTSSTTSPRCPVCATLIIVTQDQPKFLKIYRNSILKLHKLSIVATLGGIAASGWFVASAYGMWALRVFMGDRVANALLERNYSRGIPFRLWRTSLLLSYSLDFH